MQEPTTTLKMTCLSQKIGRLVEFYRLLKSKFDKASSLCNHSGFSLLYSLSGLPLNFAFQSWIFDIGCHIPTMASFIYLLQIIFVKQLPHQQRYICPPESSWMQTLHQENPLRWSHVYDLSLNRTALGFLNEEFLYVLTFLLHVPSGAQPTFRNLPTFRISFLHTRNCSNFLFKKRSVNGKHCTLNTN